LLEITMTILSSSSGDAMMKFVSVAILVFCLASRGSQETVRGKCLFCGFYTVSWWIRK
jgi:hypothetical protein